MAESESPLEVVREGPVARSARAAEARPRILGSRACHLREGARPSLERRPPAFEGT